MLYATIVAQYSAITETLPVTPYTARQADEWDSGMKSLEALSLEGARYHHPSSECAYLYDTPKACHNSQSLLSLKASESLDNGT